MQLRYCGEQLAGPFHGADTAIVIAMVSFSSSAACSKPLQF
jgi:hypothetical protein